jgi:hypothetical protein
MEAYMKGVLKSIGETVEVSIPFPTGTFTIVSGKMTGKQGQALYYMLMEIPSKGNSGTTNKKVLVLYI